MSVAFISSAETPVKWVFSRWLSWGSISASTGSDVRISWLFTRLSDSITTAMKLPASTAISSNRCTVAAVR